MLAAAYVFAGLATSVHVYIFWLEAIAFAAQGRKVFGIDPDDARVVAPWAYNQGFYNLFLAVGTGVGIALVDANQDASVALVAMGTGSMLAAATVLITSDRSKARAAVVQGLLPALALACLVVWGLAS